jgi:hypothetical protein
MVNRCNFNTIQNVKKQRNPSLHHRGWLPSFNAAAAGITCCTKNKRKMNILIKNNDMLI